MRVESLHFNSIQSMKPMAQAASQVPEGQSCSFETSIYDKKGLTLPFGTWAKGANEAEEACIKVFRKVREGRRRKYTEPQIVGFMNELHATPQENNIKSVINEIFMTHRICFEEFGAPLKSAKPDAELVENYLKVAKNCDEYERLGLIGFTQHELCAGATKPLEALANSTPEQQHKFVKIMNDISFISGGTEKAEVLYEDLRHVIYATEDLPKLDAAGKLEYLSDVCHDYKRFKSDDSFENETVKESVVRISKDIVDAMMEVLKI